MLAFRGKFSTIAVFYIITLLLAFSLAVPYITTGGEYVEGGDSPGTAVNIFLWILVATAVFIAVIKFIPWLFKYFLAFLEILFLFSTTSVITLILNLPATLPFLAVVIRIIWWGNKIVQNVSTALIVGTSVGIVGAGIHPIVGVLLLLTLMLYDYVSVFVTKHMVILAKAIGAAEKPSRTEEHLLGAGDVAIPGILAVSLARISLITSIMSAVGAVLGLLFTVWITKRWKRILPALPSIGFVQLFLTTVGLLIG